ncbi:MAG: gamma-glutamyltransferase [Rubrobacter sp.]|nr:gamma-glutamyltransferase [Rubrobacter sp.]
MGVTPSRRSSSGWRRVERRRADDVWRRGVWGGSRLQRRKGRDASLDSGSRTPATLDPDVFRPPAPNYAQNRRSAKAASTSGIVNTWEVLSNDYGRLEWRPLLARRLTR